MNPAVSYTCNAVPIGRLIVIAIGLNFFGTSVLNSKFGGSSKKHVNFDLRNKKSVMLA